MELIWASEDFEINGARFPGFPILLDRDMRGVEPANRFLQYLLVHRGRVSSRKSWGAFAQHLYDYFGYIEAQRLEWNGDFPPGECGPIAMYRDYCLNVCRLAPRTINQRLSTITRFYRYAHQLGWTASVPFQYEAVRARPRTDFYAHLTGGGSVVASPDVMLRVGRPSVSFLVPADIRTLLTGLKNPTHRMMVRMGLQAGLRREEIASFPAAYVRNAERSERPREMLKIRLRPNDGTGMKTKGSTPRDIYVSKTFMSDLWHYKLHSRGPVDGSDIGPLFLNHRGVAWADDGRGFSTLLRAAGKRLGIDVWPHLLRHTYATYTLAALSKSGASYDPLLFLQKQLGHASISTTAIYTHLIDEAVESAVSSYDREVSLWSA